MLMMGYTSPFHGSYASAKKETRQEERWRAPPQGCVTLLRMAWKRPPAKTARYGVTPCSTSESHIFVSGGAVDGERHQLGRQSVVWTCSPSSISNGSSGIVEETAQDPACDVVSWSSHPPGSAVPLGTLRSSHTPAASQLCSERTGLWLFCLERRMARFWGGRGGER